MTINPKLLEPTLLWENQNPNVALAPFNLPITNPYIYKKLIIEYKTNSGTWMGRKRVEITANYGGYRCYISEYTTSAYRFIRSIRFDAASLDIESGGSTSPYTEDQGNNAIIITRIWGVIHD